jgi:hypothetical protein
MPRKSGNPLLAAVQALQPDLETEKGAALVTNGGAGFVDPNLDGMLTQYGMMGASASPTRRSTSSSGSSPGRSSLTASTSPRS